MPWEEVHPLDQRKELIKLFQCGLFTVVELAELFGISSCGAARTRILRAPGGQESGPVRRSKLPRKVLPLIERAGK